MQYFDQLVWIAEIGHYGWNQPVWWIDCFEIKKKKKHMIHKKQYVGKFKRCDFFFTIPLHFIFVFSEKYFSKIYTKVHRTPLTLIYSFPWIDMRKWCSRVLAESRNPEEVINTTEQSRRSIWRLQITTDCGRCEDRRFWSIGETGQKCLFFLFVTKFLF